MASNADQANAAKGRGNTAFAAGNFEKAIEEFTAAVALNPTNHVFFSNRAGAYASMGNHEKALEDANLCIAAKGDWVKGYSRKGAALTYLGRHEEAKTAYDEGCAVDPTNSQCQEGSASAEKKMAATGGNPLFGEAMWGKLATDPTTREYLNDPQFVSKMKMLQANPSMMSSFASDPQLASAIGVILGMGANAFGGAGAGGPGGPRPAEAAQSEPAEEEEEELDVEELKEKEQKQKAKDAKDSGNKFYKTKKFDEAIAKYEEAIALDPTDPNFLNNVAAALLEKKEYDQCIAKCKEALEVAQVNRADYKIKAKSWCRIASCYTKQKLLAEAEAAYDKALLENHDSKTKRALQKVQLARKKQVEEAYLSEEESELAKGRGNEFFKSQKWIEAIAEYTDALKRWPKNYKVYSNRAACYTKLMDWQRALEDCDTCLTIDPTFVKVYIRKAKVQHFLKQYHKALTTFDQGLALDPACGELVDGKRLTQYAIQQENQSGNVDPARAREAMKDPEIQAILQDPAISNVLQRMQDDPQGANAALADPVIRAKIEKLVAAGILSVGSR